LKKFLQSWLINTLAVLVAVYLVKGLHYDRPLDVAIAALILGILNSVIRPFLIFLAFPLVLVTLGLFMLVINAGLLYFVGWLLQPHFYVQNFRSAFWGAVIISIVSLVLNSLTGTGNSRIKVHRHRGPPSRSDGGGPVIDI
jgi:putative membrane protein